MTKISNFALKIKEGDREGGTCEVLRPCHPPPPKKKKKLERALRIWYNDDFPQRDETEIKRE